MKRIILSVLAIGLSMGVMAQTKSDAEISLASKKINVQTPKSTDIYTQFDESCATLDSIKFYQAQHQGQFRCTPKAEWQQRNWSLNKLLFGNK